MRDKRPRSELSQPELDMLEIEAWLPVNSAARESFERLVKWTENDYRAHKEAVER